MENRYYTPQIEEFRIGFEYERNETQPKNYYDIPMEYEKKWVYHKWNESQTRLGKLRYIIHDKDIRVKYLDSSDIESFGFKYLEKISVEFYEDISGFIDIIGTGPYNINKDIGFFGKKIGYSWYIIDFRGNNIVTIRKKGKVTAQAFDEIFKGKIKNKSELEVLLSQLGILDSQITNN